MSRWKGNETVMRGGEAEMEEWREAKMNNFMTLLSNAATAVAKKR